MDTQNNLEYIKKSFELKNSGLYKEAIEMLYRALETSDGECGAEIVSQIGDLYLLLDNPKRAVEEYEKALECDSKHIHSLEKIEEIYFNEKKFPLALEISNKLLELSNDVKYAIGHLNILKELGNFEKMEEVFNSFGEEIKNNSEVLHIMSQVNANNKAELLKKAVEQNKDYTPATVELAIEYFYQEKFDQAQELFEHIANSGESAIANLYLGQIAHIKGEFFEAIELFLQSIKLDKYCQKSYLELAKAYIDINWLEEAQIALKNAISLGKIKEEHNTNLDEHYFLLAWVMSKTQDLKGALLYLDFIEENSIMYPNAQILKNTLSMDDKNYVQAKEVLEKYYNSNPQDAKNPILLDSLGRIYKQLKMHKNAIDLYKSALEAFPNSVFYTLELIDILIDDKDYNQALQYTKELEQSAPKCPSTYNSFARIYYRLKNYDLAIENLSILNSLDLNNAEGFYFLGLVQNDTNQAEAAISNFKIALSLNPEPAKYYAQMARAYETLGDFENAMLYIKEAIEIAPEEINYKNQAKGIAQKLGDSEKEAFYTSQIKRLEQLLKQR